MKKILLAAALLPASAAAFAGVTAQPMGPDHTLVRVPQTGRYLMLPVQDNGPEAQIRVLADGKLDRTLVVRLAKDSTDLYVPFDLAPYQGKELALSVAAPQSRDYVCWDAFELADTFQIPADKFRPAFHHAPQWGWMNDPNGMFYKDGLWHLNYQWNPYGPKWQNLSWGHATSPDLVHWTQQQPTLQPDGLGMIFSGSTVVAPDGNVYAYYTSCEATQQQSMAVSDDDGMTFTPHAANPVVVMDTEARDPHVFFDKERNQWVMMLAHALEHEQLIFTSDNLTDWALQSSFGKGLGAQQGVWECPDLFELPVQGTDGQKKWMFVVNINPDGPFGGSGTQYFIGDFDGKSFTPDRAADGSVPTKWMDWGKDNYATVTWDNAPDNRRVAIGWMSNWEYADRVPTLQFRSANTLPRDIGLFLADDGEVYSISTPSPEVEALRGKPLVKDRKLNLTAKTQNVKLPTDGLCEIVADIEPSTAKTVSLTLLNAAGEKSVITYEVDKDELSFDRTASGITDFAQEFPAVTTAKTFAKDGTLRLRVFVDRSSVEIFANDGRMAMTNLVFPNLPYTSLAIKAEGRGAKANITVYPIK